MLPPDAAARPRFIHSHCDRIAAKQPLVQQFDPRAFDKSKLNQPPFELRGRQPVTFRHHADPVDSAGKPHWGGTKRHGAVRHVFRGRHTSNPSFDPKVIATRFHLQVISQRASGLARRKPQFEIVSVIIRSCFCSKSAANPRLKVAGHARASCPRPSGFD
jgi:hypothetical protein